MSSTNRRTRVLWLAKGLGPGGMERLLVHHARLGDPERFDYQAAYLVDRPNSVVPELEALGVPCANLGDSGGGLRWLNALSTLVRDHRIDIVHAHSPMPAACARPVLRARRPHHRPRLVYTEHNTWDCYGRATRLANMVTFPLDDHQFAVSAAAAASPPVPFARRVEVLTHGIDLAEVRAAGGSRDAVRRDLGVGADTVVVVTVANLRAEKAYDVLLAAADRVLAQHDDVVFLSVGQGPMMQEMQRRHSELGLGERFRFLGFRDDVSELLAASDVFCLSSRQEGLPVAFMEAAALGVPAVVTAVGGLPDAVLDRESGLLVVPGRPDELAGALSSVIGDSALRRRLADGASIAGDRFDAGAAIARQEAVYSELVR